MRGQLRIDLTDNCNIRCIACQTHCATPPSETRFLDFDLFRRQTQGQLGEWLAIQLGNIGEPTLHPRFAEFVRHIRAESDEEILIVTNGKTLDRLAGVLTETRCHVLVSVDSLRPETHEYIRSGSDYRRLMDHLKLLDLSRVRVSLSFTLMRSNVADYGEMIEFCSRHGYGLTAFPMSLRAHQGVLPYALVWESLWFCKDRLDEWMRRFYGKDYGHMVSGAATGSPAWRPTEFTCNAHETDLMIDARGDVVLCLKENLPNLASMRLEEIWNSAAAVKFRTAVEKDRGPCRTCDYRERCLAPSMARMENHFSTEINESLSADTHEAIRFDGPLTDDEKMRRFLQDIASTFALYAIWKDPGGHKAIRMTEFADIGPPDRVRDLLLRRFPNRVIAAKASWELHRLLAETAGQSSTPKLLEENVNGHNLVGFRGSFWAIPCALGPVHLRDPYHRAKPGIIQAPSLEDLKRRIIGEKPPPGPSAPRLVESHFCGHNLVAYMGLFWAAPLALGPLDLTDPAQRARPGIIRAETLDALKASLAKADSLDALKKPIEGRLARNPHEPVLVEKFFHGYNLVGYRDLFWGLPLALGPVDLREPEVQRKEGVVQAADLRALQAQIRSRVLKQTHS